MTLLRKYLVPLLAALISIAVFHSVVALHWPGYYWQAVWDEGYYVEIVTKGYKLENGVYSKYSSLPFSPGYPTLIRALAEVGELFVGRSLEKKEVVLLFRCVSGLLFILGTLGVASLFDTFSRDRLRRNCSVLLFALWPGSMYFHTAYAEALYMPLAAWFLVCLVKKRYLSAAVLAMLALSTRNPAIILLPTLFLSVLIGALRDNAVSIQPSSTGRVLLRTAPWLVLYSLIGSLGVGFYMAKLYLDVGEPLAFLKAYSAWSGVKELGLERWFGGLPLLAWLTFPRWLSVQIAVALFVVIPPLIILWRRRLPVPAILFVAIGWLFFVDRSGQLRPFVDMLRWTAILFPVHYCIVLFFYWVGRMTDRPRSIMVSATVTFAAINAAVFAYLVQRFLSEKWVS